MRNILSFTEDTELSGQEILDWAKYHSENNTPYKKYAKIILRRFPNLQPNTKYVLKLNHVNQRWFDYGKTPWVVRADKNVPQH